MGRQSGAGLTRLTGMAGELRTTDGRTGRQAGAGLTGLTRLTGLTGMAGELRATDGRTGRHAGAGLTGMTRELRAADGRTGRQAGAGLTRLTGMTRHARQLRTTDGRTGRHARCAAADIEAIARHTDRGPAVTRGRPLLWPCRTLRARRTDRLGLTIANCGHLFFPLVHHAGAICAFPTHRPGPFPAGYILLI